MTPNIARSGAGGWSAMRFGLPALAGLILFVIVPFILALALTFTNQRLVSPEPGRFVGLANYERLLSVSYLVQEPERDASGSVLRNRDGEPRFVRSRDVIRHDAAYAGYRPLGDFRLGDRRVTMLASDPAFLRSLGNTFFFAVLVVPLQCAVALGLALLVNSGLKGQTVFRALFFSPVVMSMVVVSVVWAFLFDKDLGLLNELLATISFGTIGPVDWLGDPQVALPSIALMSAWQGAGFQMLAFIFVFPFLFMLASSLKGNAAIFADVSSLRAILPVGELSGRNYAAVFERGNIGHFLGNSLIVTIITVVSGLFVNSLAAFALARLEWRGKQVVLTVLVVLLAIPLEAISVPMMVVVAKLPGLDFSNGIALTRSWLDTRYVQIVPFVANAFSVFLFYQFFRDIPKDLDEAAYIDGATPFQVFRHIIVPSSLPVFATVTILQSLAMWNQYLWPAITVPGQEARPLMIGMQQFFSARRVEWGEVMAYASVITVPVLGAFIIFQRWFVRSVIGSGVKG